MSRQFTTLPYTLSIGACPAWKKAGRSHLVELCTRDVGDNERRYWVECSCGVRGPVLTRDLGYCTTEQEGAVEAWNDLPRAPTQAEELEQLRGELGRS